jgi:hypothetical protein
MIALLMETLVATKSVALCPALRPFLFDDQVSAIHPALLVPA